MVANVLANFCKYLHNSIQKQWVFLLYKKAISDVIPGVGVGVAKMRRPGVGVAKMKRPGVGVAEKFWRLRSPAYNTGLRDSW